MANAISSVCVTDDEVCRSSPGLFRYSWSFDYQSCERIRVALEGFEDATEIEAFARGYGTGPKIPGACLVWAVESLNSKVDAHRLQTRLSS